MQTLGLTLLLIVPPAVLAILMLENASDVGLARLLKALLGKQWVSEQEKFLQTFQSEFSAFSQQLQMQRNREQRLLNTTIAIKRTARKTRRSESESFSPNELEVLQRVEKVAEQVRVGLVGVFVRDRKFFNGLVDYLSQYVPNIALKLLCDVCWNSHGKIDTYPSLMDAIRELEFFAEELSNANQWPICEAC